jgi:hypothetical protein
MEKPAHSSSSELQARRQPISEARLDGLAGMAVIAEAAAMAPYEAMMAGMGDSAPDHEAALSDRDYFNDIYLLAPVGYFVLGFDTAILQMNVVGADLLGLARNNPDQATFRQFIASRFHDDFDRFLRRAVNSSQPEQCDLQMARARNQQGFPVTLRASADGSGQACRMVVERAEGKLAALERSEERFRRIVHSAEEGIWEIDAVSAPPSSIRRWPTCWATASRRCWTSRWWRSWTTRARPSSRRNIAQRQHGAAERHEFKFLRATAASVDHAGHQPDLRRRRPLHGRAGAGDRHHRPAPRPS